MPLLGTEDAFNPFFSPDGRWLGYLVNGGLRKLPLAGGNLELITPLGSSALFGAHWGADDRIFFVPNWTENIRVVSAGGGESKGFLPLDTDKGEEAHVWPQELPGGKVLYGDWDDSWYVSLFDPESGTRAELFRNGHHARWVPTGHLVYAQDNFLFARSFDPADLTPQNGSRGNLTIRVEKGRLECRRRGTAQSRSYGSYGRLRWSWPAARRSRMPAAS